jgi:hypothetical protein
MSAKTKAGAAGQAAALPKAQQPPSKRTDVQRLQALIHDADWLAQTAFTEIRITARLALLALESPEGHLHPELIAGALSAIWAKADTAENAISAAAEEVGCAYVDEAMDRRFAARAQAQTRREAVQGGSA